MQRTRVKCALYVDGTSDEGGYVREIEKKATELCAVEVDKRRGEELGENSTERVVQEES